MRVIGVSTKGILDSLTGEITETLDIEKLLITEPGGIIAGNNLYPILAELAPQVQQDEGWTMTVNMQQRRTKPMTKDTRLTGKIYISRLTYRRAKVGGRKNRRRPPAIKWVVLELGLFMEDVPMDLPGIVEAAQSLYALAARRGIKPRSSPGSFGAAMLRASSEWVERRPAPRFVSEIAREHLPGNFYAISNTMKGKQLDHVYYLDQESSHHKIASSVVIPHPHTIRARGHFRAAENGDYKKWTNKLDRISEYEGLLLCMVHTTQIPREQEHLYPPWARIPGSHTAWIWTPELRLFKGDHRLQFEHVICGLLSPHEDFALWEYADWALEQRKRPDSHIFKSALLAAYGMLACRTDLPVQLLSVHGRKPSPNQTVVELPLLPRVYRSEVKRKRVPALQNVVARGIIEAETRTRSLEYAKRLEAEGVPVAQVYADGLLAVADPALFPVFDVPEHWRVAASLTRVFSPHPNSIISDQLVRLPGIIGSAAEAYASAWETPTARAVLAGRPGQID